MVKTSHTWLQDSLGQMIFFGYFFYNAPHDASRCVGCSESSGALMSHCSRIVVLFF
jgi:hypothetical protein